MSKEKKVKRKQMPKKYFIGEANESALHIVNPLDDIASFVEHSYGISKGAAYRTILEPKLL